MSKDNQPRKTRAKRDPEEQLIEIANQMLQLCSKKCAVNPSWAMQCGPATFCLRLEGLYEQLDVLSSEKLGFIVGIGLGLNTRTLWRHTSIEQLDSLAAYFPPAGSWNLGKHVLVGLARLVIAAAIYDIMATEYVLGSSLDMRRNKFDYDPPHKLKMFVRRVRLGQKL